ncbi:MAG TPA: error-prone DNA polymerase [Burkholderiales bacterium]|nr:error-prone DNA polymerase [Burkholderiales bacterium]
MQPKFPAYAELHCLSNFSFLRGASHPHELVEKAHELGYSALAITDECSIAGVVRAHEAIKKLPPDASLKLIVGSEIRLDDGLKLVLLAADREGYGNLCSLITLGRTREEKGSYRLARHDLSGGLPGCLALLVPGVKLDQGQARFVAECFPHRAWIAVELFCGPNDKSQLARLRELARDSGLPLVAAGDVHMHKPSRRELQDVLTAIRLGIPVTQAGHALYPNAERRLRQLVRLAQLYTPELLSESLEIAARCNFSLDSLRYEYPDEIVPPGHTPATYLRELTEQGLRERFPHGTEEKVRFQVEKELALIGELKYEPFFLTVYDVVRFARSKNILCQGRGSAANSTVCYALGITEVNPERMNVLFERFLSRERNEPPDIDVDFEHQRREEVIQYVYSKYGRDRAAIAATLITYQPRSAVRDVGKALSLPVQVDLLARSLVWWDGSGTLRERLSDSGLDPDSRVIRKFVELVRVLIRFPRHLSQHVGGFVISRGPLSRLVPIENAAMPGRSIIQWDKDDLETLGLLKVDVLALGMLTAIRRAFDFVDGTRLASTQMKEVLEREEDQAVYGMICKADTIGAFQIESRAQMSMLPRLKPTKFYDLVIEVAIVRPGPIQGDMVHPYLKRRKMDPKDIPYEKEALRPVLERTRGVPIFQEQVMHLAMVAADFTPDEADGLRRSMAAWKRKGGLEKYEDKLRKGMAENGYSDAFITRICKQVQGFSDYGFPESHAASFALLAYVSSWLKYHHPAAFLAALLNSQPMGFYSVSALMQDARRHGVEVRPVDVTTSDWDSTLERDDDAPPAVRLGFSLAKGISEESVKRIVTARTKTPFSSIDDLARRCDLSRRDLHGLAAAGSLASLAGHRRNAHWLAAGERPSGILHEAPINETQPRLAPPSEREDMTADYASLDLTLGRHPLALLRQRLQRMRFATAADLKLLRSGTLARAIGMVTGRQRPQTAKGTIFVTLEDETGYTNVIVWGDLAERQQHALLGSKLLGVEGVMEKEGDVMHLVARQLTDHSLLLGPLGVKSRDFH